MHILPIDLFGLNVCCECASSTLLTVISALLELLAREGFLCTW